jgi:hypothetical protein
MSRIDSVAERMASEARSLMKEAEHQRILNEPLSIANMGAAIALVRMAKCLRAEKSG